MRDAGIDQEQVHAGGRAVAPLRSASLRSAPLRRALLRSNVTPGPAGTACRAPPGRLLAIGWLATWLPAQPENNDDAAAPAVPVKKSLRALRREKWNRVIIAQRGVRFMLLFLPPGYRARVVIAPA